jgi:hypothetical protein
MNIHTKFPKDCIYFSEYRVWLNERAVSIASFRFSGCLRKGYLAEYSGSGRNCPDSGQITGKPGKFNRMAGVTNAGAVDYKSFRNFCSLAM